MYRANRTRKIENRDPAGSGDDQSPKVRAYRCQLLFYKDKGCFREDATGRLEGLWLRWGNGLRVRQGNNKTIDEER
jgi:hypothetical protein